MLLTQINAMLAVLIAAHDPTVQVPEEEYEERIATKAAESYTLLNETIGEQLDDVSMFLDGLMNGIHGPRQDTSLAINVQAGCAETSTESKQHDGSTPNLSRVADV